jgi:hypothetical protein
MRRENNDVVSLRRGIAMIEVQYNDVGLTAVNAGMSPQVFADERTIFIAVPADPCDFLLDVRLAIAEIVLTSVRGVTAPATALARASSLVRESKRLDWLD